MQAISISNINTKPHEPSLADFMSQLEMLTSSTSFEDFGILGTFDLIINRYEDNFKLQDLSKSKQMSLCLNSLSRISPFILPNFRFKKKKNRILYLLQNRLGKIPRSIREHSQPSSIDQHPCMRPSPGEWQPHLSASKKWDQVGSQSLGGRLHPANG